MADLEALGLIKKLDASFTWPHPTDKDYYVAAVFVRTEEDKPYLIYCPKISSSVSINEEEYNPFAIWGKDEARHIQKLDLHQGMAKVGDTLFMVFPLYNIPPKEINKKDIEKMFGVKVVE